MYKHICVPDFISEINNKLSQYPTCTVRSIGVDSDGYFTIRLVNKYDNEYVVRIRSFEDKRY